MKFTLLPQTRRLLNSYPAKNPASLNWNPRIWAHDALLWKTEESHVKEIRSRLGWLDVPADMLKGYERLKADTEAILKAGFTDAVLLGMGGSSLAPEVFQKVFGTSKGKPRLWVLDSTDPEKIRSVDAKLNLKKTLFIFSSKSGTTIEPLSLFQYFFERVKSVSPRNPGDHFITVTDPGTFLENLAREKKFRHIFLSRSDIGGRFSALSPFGLVPAALIGIDIRKLLDRTMEFRSRCLANADANKNEAFGLGLALGLWALEGRNKLTLVTPRAWASLGDWVEQLVAESTGKEGKGIVPVIGEKLLKPSAYGPDRLFVGMTDSTPEGKLIAKRLAALEEAGHPVLIIEGAAPYDLGAEFFRWEYATAVCGIVLGINPFDQPNVQEAKDSAKKFLDQIEVGQKPAAVRNRVPGLPFALRLSRRVKTWADFWQNIGEGDYVNLLAFLPDEKAPRRVLESLKTSIQARTRAAVNIGFGPRYLHSTGQLHKGDNGSGVFCVIVRDKIKDLKIPGKKFSFGELEFAQASGDFEALDVKHRRAALVYLEDLSARSLAGLTRSVLSSLKR